MYSHKILSGLTAVTMTAALFPFCGSLSTDAALNAEEVTEFKALPGNGLTACLAGSVLRGGSYKYINETIRIPSQLQEQANRLAEEGKTPLLFAKDEMPLGIIAVADVIKEDGPEAIRQLRNMGQ